MKYFSAIIVVVLLSCGAGKDYEPAFDYGTASNLPPTRKANADSILRQSLMPATPVAAAPASTASGRVNPAHGVPGHRCDVPVGALLESGVPPASSAPATASITPAAAPVAGAAPAAKGLNPAHGVPGHRCDIAVGAPLNSKPAPVTPAAMNKAVAAGPGNKAAPGMNPAHGQPGHRCDIAVGAPLNSKPATPAASGASTPVPVAVDTAVH